MIVDIEKLKAAAEKVTSGEWYEPGDLRFEDRKTGDLHGLHHDDEYYIAAANPAVVLELIADNESTNSRLHEVAVACATAARERDQLRAEVAGLRTGYEAYEQVNAELKAENEALRRERDARHPFKPFHEPAIGFTGCVICGVYTDHGSLPCPKTRATADAAMGQGEQS